ncbi:hypothetical protein JR316_0002266 [Psilocybe cubensis]|uniref:Uncharacterized protein n=2 Tax=Psilocybe cubensis TaxID=181762 RepID=A0A8H8CPE1_PSICU|nr:hypothetical protein JR316_0002266 [Psilocybe cubensis]KAH9485358.1 hypothetical protein JR316_0002266 [Psilocybe cubensis]
MSTERMPSQDGLSIPFFNLGMNVSRSVSISATLTSRTRVYPDWLLGISRTPTLPREPTSEVVPPEDEGQGNTKRDSLVDIIHNETQQIAPDHECPMPPQMEEQDALNLVAEVARDEPIEPASIKGPKAVHFP